MSIITDNIEYYFCQAGSYGFITLNLKPYDVMMILFFFWLTGTIASKCISYLLLRNKSLSKCNNLKQHIFNFLTVSEGRESGGGLVGWSSIRVFSGGHSQAVGWNLSSPSCGLLRGTVWVSSQHGNWRPFSEWSWKEGERGKPPWCLQPQMSQIPHKVTSSFLCSLETSH